MDALLTTFIAGVLAEFGDKTQLLVVALLARYGNPGRILAALVLAAFFNALIAAFAGTFINGMITARATSLLVALTLVFAGVAGLIGQKQPDLPSGWRTGAFLTAFAALFFAEFGDKTQLLTGALAARFDSVLFATVGATAGIVAATAPAVLLGDRTWALLPVRAIRIGGGILLLLAGFIVAVTALRLV